MELTILVFLFVLILIAEDFLDNFWWIGIIIVLYLLFSIVRQIIENGKDGFDIGEVIIILMKIATIVATIWLVLFLK